MRRLTALSTTLLPAVYATAAFAAEHGAGHEAAGEHAAAAHGHGGIPWLTIAFSTINLIIFIYILVRAAAPAVKSWVSERRALIVQELEDAAAERGEAERLRNEWEARLAKLEQEIAEMRAQARADIERERERILDAARVSAANMLRDAQRLAAAEGAQIEAQIRAEVARKAIAAAQDKIQKNWTSDDQRRLVADFLRQVQS